VATAGVLRFAIVDVCPECRGLGEDRCHDRSASTPSASTPSASTTSCRR